MRKITVFSTLFFSLFSLNLLAMGLGDIRVRSFLNQPFDAEIELIDADHTPLSEIKVNLALPEDFERVGLERAFSLGFLTLTVEKHANGKPFIKVTSREGITDPFMQLLVDLAWADGQVYRAYTVLLDPPNYQLTMAKAQLHRMIQQQLGSDKNEPGVIDKTVYSQVERAAGKSEPESRGLIVYGPTLPNETIWQIAQRYKSEHFILQQMILAIVGMNPEAFTDGNLNGLREGSRLRIPDPHTIKQVSSELSILEVPAHDSAWQSKNSIAHALLPPYINTGAPAETQPKIFNEAFQIPPIPILSSHDPVEKEMVAVPFFSTVSSFISGNGGGDAEVSLKEESHVLPKQKKLVSDIDIAAAAIASIRQTNGKLMHQLQVLQENNKRLVQQLKESRRQINRLHQKIKLLVSGKEILEQSDSISTKVKQKSIFSWAIVLFEFSLIVLLLFFGFWYWFKTKSNVKLSASDKNLLLESDNPVLFENTPLKPEQEVRTEPILSSVDEVHEPITFFKDEALENKIESIEKPIEPIALQEAVDEAKTTNHSINDSDDHTLEFDLGTPEISDGAEGEVNEKPKDSIENNPINTQQDEHSIDFVSSSDQVTNLKESTVSQEPANPVKSSIALTTLLELGKTYLSMGDIEAAKQSLQEVIEFGDKTQRKQAKQLLDRINKNNAAD